MSQDAIAWYLTRPATRQAIRWTGKNNDAVAEFVNGQISFDRIEDDYGELIKEYGMLWVDANKSWIQIEPGEWVVADKRGHYPCKDDVFRENYDVSSPLQPPAQPYATVKEYRESDDEARRLATREFIKEWQEQSGD